MFLQCTRTVLLKPTNKSLKVQLKSFLFAFKDALSSRQNSVLSLDIYFSQQ